MKNKNYKKILLFFAVLGISIFVRSGRVHAATMAVNTGNDTITANSQCTLSEALQNINDQAQTSPDCAAGDGDDTIVLLNGTITLTANLPTITTAGSLTINGAGPGSIIDGGDAYTGLVNNSPASEMILSNLTIRHTSSGFNISANNCDFTNVNVVESLTNNQIFCDATLTVSNLDVTGATSPSGSGLMIEGDDTLVADLDNIRVHDGIGNNSDKGAIYLQNIANLSANHIELSNFGCAGDCIFGGMVYIGVTGQTATFSNITIVENTGSAAGLFLNTDSDVALQNITIADNVGVTTNAFPMTVGGLIYISQSPGEVTIQNTLLANNTADGDDSNCFLGSIQGFGAASIPSSLGNNLSDDTTCAASFNQTSDFNNVDSGLDTFELDGFSKVYTLLATSPAVDGGAAILGVSDDQRGTARPQGGAYDIGAYETTLAKVTTGGSGGGGSGGSGNSPNAPSTQAGQAAVPKVPNTGFSLIRNNPLVAAGASIVATGALLIAARKYRIS